MQNGDRLTGSWNGGQLVFNRTQVRQYGRVFARNRALLLVAVVALGGIVTYATADPHGEGGGERPPDGQQIFRHDTFGDEAFWTDQLKMNAVIEDSLDPVTALSLGLKVDADALPAGLLAGLTPAQLADPQTTLALLNLDAVVGVRGKVETGDNGKLHLTRVGVTCALCHSTVDDSAAAGIGHRLDGWPNRDLDPGAIIAASPTVPEAARQVYRSWGPGRYDPRFNIDGLSTPVIIPPAYGLDGVKLATYTGDGDISYWNNYVAVTQMGGQGVFIDKRIGVKVVRTPDLVHRVLKPLRDYQHELEIPAAPAGSFDPAGAAAGRVVFHGAGRCATCHAGEHFTDANRGRLHAPAETGMDPAYAQRSATGKYRTTPLRALARHAPYFHDGSAKTLADVVEHYDAVLRLRLTDQQKADLVEYLKSL
jgi:mono/diheme cytochrome c family protein